MLSTAWALVQPASMTTQHTINTLLQQGDYTQAQQKLEKQLQQHPSTAWALNLLGQLYAQGGAGEQALTMLEKATLLEPNNQHYASLGICLHLLQRYQEAIAAFDSALSYKADDVETLNNRGMSLARLGKYRPALSSYRAGLKIQPQHIDALYNSAKACDELGRYEQSLAGYKEVLKIQPHYAKAHNNKAVLLETLGRPDEAHHHYKTALAIDPQQYTCHSNFLLSLNRPDTIKQSEILHQAHQFAIQTEKEGSVFKAPPTTSLSQPLRVGFVSGDFTRHSVAYFFMPLLSSLDQSQIEIHCYYNRDTHTDYTKEIAEKATTFTPIAHLTTDEVVALIRTAHLDIVIDLSGHANHNRLPAFAQRLAPLQLNWIGYPNTTGLTAMDYRLVDAITDPSTNNDHCSEKLLRIAPCFLCYEPPRGAPEVAHQKNDCLVFGSFSNSEKITPSTITLWSNVLKAVPNSQLHLKSIRFNRPEITQRLEDAFTTQGIEKQRLRFLAPSDTTEKHLENYTKIDIALDTIPYNGTTTTCEALYMGTPVLALLGTVHRARVSASLLHACNHPELISESKEDYVRCAATLAGDRKRLDKLHSSLRQDMLSSPLCDSVGFSKKWTELISNLVRSQRSNSTH